MIDLQLCSLCLERYYLAIKFFDIGIFINT